MESLKDILPLIGVALGWALKALADYWSARKQEAQLLRKATFHLLRTYKAFLDYDRGTTYFRIRKPPVDEYEPRRRILQGQLLREVEPNASSLSSAIEVLASIDPVMATTLYNEIRNLNTTFKRNFGDLATSDPSTYADMVNTQDGMVLRTLDVLERVSLGIAKRSGWFQRRKVRAWIEKRKQGEADYIERMDEQAKIRERAWGFSAGAENASPPDPAS